ACERDARPSRPDRTRRPSHERALGRRASSCRDRAGAHWRSGDPSRGRADRESRQRERRGAARALRRVARARADGAARDARRADRVARRAHDPHARRPGSRRVRPGDLLAMSLGNYGRARLRSGLTTAGVAIGTALVVLLIALATGAEDNVRRSIFSIGDLRLVTVQPFQPGANGLSAVPRTITDDTVAKLKSVAHVHGVYRQFDAPLGMVVEGGDDATIRPQGIEPGAPVDRGDLLAGRHIEVGDRAVAVLPGNIARLVAPNAGAAVGRSVTMRVGGAVKLGSTRIGGSGTPRDYAVKIVGVFDEQASQ